MAVDNLNYYSSWLPAWQQTDKYSSQPWCLKSKNLDIFSSSKSVKATAWSVPSQWASDIIKQDGDLILKTDWKVYDISSWSEVLVVDPSVNFPVYQVSYNGSSGTYEDAQWGTVQDMSVKYEWDEWKSLVVFTDRASYVLSKTKWVATKSFEPSSNITVDESTVWNDWGGYHGYQITKANTTASSASIVIRIDTSTPFTKIPVWICADQADSTDTNISLYGASYRKQRGYYYDWEMDAIVPKNQGTLVDLTITWNILDWILLEIPTFPRSSTSVYFLELHFRWTKKEWASSFSWNNSYIYLDVNWWPYDENHKMIIWSTESDGDYWEYYTYLPIRDRKLQDIWEYYWMKWTSFQPIWNWEWSWVNVNWEKKTRYDFAQYMWWANDPAMDVIGMIVWNEQVYMIWNMNWNWYIIPCDLSGWRWTPYIAYWCEFKWVTNIDYLLYLVWEDRGISTLWVFNGQELVPVIWGNRESWNTDLIGVDEQYNFDWKIVNWRKNLILTTTDNRIFQYWPTYWGKGWAFIHELPANAVITWLVINWNDLVINYSITVNDTTTNYSITYQDDIAKKNYNTEWEAVYPVVLGNHLLEKEESDLYVSYILPCASASLEFWGCANHYHFWTFTSSDNATLSESESYKIKWASGTYALKFIERNNDQYTFKLEWDLPVNTTSEMKITDSSNAVVLNYTSFNHFRKIWSISAWEYQEWEFRFHNINNKLDLPKSHSLQIMVKGKGTANYTPELFSLDLVANQRDRW